MGGMYRVIESLIAIAEASGVRFIYNAPAKQIIVKGNQATGVRLQDDSVLAADVIVANADLPYVYHDLLPGADGGGTVSRVQSQESRPTSRRIFAT